MDKLWFQPSHTKKARSILWCPENRQFFRTGLAKQLSLSGKSLVFPDKLCRKVFSVLHNRYDLKVIGLVEWSADGPAQLCPRNRHFGGQTMISAQLCPRNQHFDGQTMVPAIPHKKSPVYSLVSGKSPVLPDKVGRKVFSVLHNRYDLKVIGLVEWSADGPAQLCPRNGTFGGQTMIPTHLCPRNQHFGGQRWVEIK